MFSKTVYERHRYAFFRTFQSVKLHQAWPYWVGGFFAWREAADPAVPDADYFLDLDELARSTMLEF